MSLVQFLPGLKNKPTKSKEKLERNDSCLCGSGKKFKKCCGGWNYKELATVNYN